MLHSPTDIAGASHDYKTAMSVGECNIGIFGVTEGTYMLRANLVDLEGYSRSCWGNASIVFSIEQHVERNRSEVLLAGFRSLHQQGRPQVREPWMPQPQGH